MAKLEWLPNSRLILRLANSVADVQKPSKIKTHHMLHSKSVAAVLLMFFGILPVSAQLFGASTVYTADETLERRIANVKSEGLMFALSVIAAPLCKKNRLA